MTPDGTDVSPREGRLVRLASMLLFAIGALSRALPLFDQGGRVLRQFPTEDGYLMLTIARNLALGNGPSVADGTILTNGTQPLATLLFAGCFWLVGGDRFWGVFLVQVLEIAIAIGGAFLLFALGRRLLANLPHGAEIALVATAVWFASPVVVRHSMNCLESGLYVASVLVVALCLVPAAERPLPQAEPSWDRWALLGLALALAFWARNDAVLLCLAVGFVHLGGGLAPDGARFGTRVAELSLAAAIVTLVALPWLAFNWLQFGHLMPISGQAESMSAAFANNLSLVPTKLFEYLTLLTPVPSALEESPWVVAASALVVAAALAVLVPRVLAWPFEQRALALVALTYVGLLAAFYGLYFGAPHFMSRYLLPSSPFFALLWATVAWRALLATRRIPWLPWAGAAAVLALSFGLNARLYASGDEHAHFQVVEWVEKNVPPDTWVGAIQTGTLGFFHDRTLNLDGKVNPHALEARKLGRVPAYVVESQIRYLIDWTGIARWERKRDLTSVFELIVNDPTLNLAVLRRRDPS